MLKFGKSAAALFTHKQAFFEDNDRLVREGRRLAGVYRSQPSRTRCKCCDDVLGSAVFEKNEIGYAICSRCGHLNGLHEDTAEFCEALYRGAGGRSYAQTYKAEAYDARVRDIYLPKARFLYDALPDPRALTFVDLGAGSGYFVAALRALDLDAVGHDVGVEQVQVADAHLGRGAVRLHDLDETVKTAAETRASVVSMIGVLEHLQNPRQVLRALRHNKHVQYLFISVPLFSPCVFFELVFPEVFQRHLAGGHTHLFTDRSLDWICTEFEMKRIAEWWFGADMMDLYRAMTVVLKKAGLESSAAVWSEMFEPTIDAMQLVLDEKRLASEVHLLLRMVGPSR